MIARWRTWSCSLGVALALAAGGALAAPPVGAPPELHGPIDPCTVANYAESDVVCELCPKAPEDSGACGRRLAALGYVQKCATTHEASQHGEVWCKSKRSAATPKAPPEETQRTLRWVVVAAAVALGGALLYFRRGGEKRGA